METVWILTVDVGDSDGVYVSAHRTKAGALSALRMNYAHGDDVSDADLISFVEEQGLDVTLSNDVLGN